MILLLLCVCSFANGAGPSNVRTRVFVGSTSFRRQNLRWERGVGEGCRGMG